MLNLVVQTMEERKDLKKYFKHVYTCKKCGRFFGSDKKTKKVCPFCNNQLIFRLKKQQHDM